MKKSFFANKVEYHLDKENKNKGEIVIEPCWPGYGITWGNALRRVLITSLPGAAVTAVRIKGVKYEFTAVDGIKEDVLDIILNLKSLRLKILSNQEGPIKLTLKVKGEKKVLAGDIEKNADVKIFNPDLPLATLTDSKASLEMDIWVVSGYGWVPSEEKTREGFELDTIVTDSIFSPVVNVSVSVENMRVGKKTDFDRISLGVETDGTINPLEAFLQASSLLSEQFQTLFDLGKNMIMPEKKEKIKKSSPKKQKKVIAVKKKTIKEKKPKTTKKTTKKKIIPKKNKKK
jgi:DNA-directed RNA polymerase subunit alpha